MMNDTHVKGVVAAMSDPIIGAASVLKLALLPHSAANFLRPV